MKFVDEVTIHVQSGNGGRGAVSFRREKFIPFGGPDGGNGGRGASVYLVAKGGLNTLVDYRFTPQFDAENGERGGGQRCSGRSGKDLDLAVPCGTRVMDAATGEVIGDLTREGDRLLVAKGGRGGLGNTHFKSATNRTPRRAQPGETGEGRDLNLELEVLADVGLLGRPNAGKSTFLRAVSDARPKVADYPFTTLHPHLGVVRVGQEQHFVVADIPGLIAGAAEGAGLGIRFLRHLKRTRLMLHLVDLSPFTEEDEPVRAVREIAAELRKFSPALARRERWLVFNKIDLVPAAKREARMRDVVRALKWKGEVAGISAATGEGCEVLTARLMTRLDERARRVASPRKKAASRKKAVTLKKSATRKS